MCKRILSVVATFSVVISSVLGQDNKTYTKVMLTNGFGTENVVTIIDLSGDFKLCHPPNQFPVRRSDHVGTFINGRPLVCGGIGDGYCYEYDLTLDEWLQTNYKLTSKEFPAAAKISDDQWWITGGYNGLELSESDMFNAGMGFEKFTELPAQLTQHVMVNIDGNHVLVTGGYESNKTWIFDMVSKEWEPKDDLDLARQGAFAGLVEKSDGTQEVVVAGGFNSFCPGPGPDCAISSSVIFDLATEKWRPGPDLPKGMAWGGSVQLGKTFVALGGWLNYFNIYEYVPDEEVWRTRPELLVPRERFAAFAVPDEYCL